MDGADPMRAAARTISVPCDGAVMAGRDRLRRRAVRQ